MTNGELFAVTRTVRTPKPVLEDAVLAVHHWAIQQDNPVEAFRTMLEILGLEIGPPTKACGKCHRQLAHHHYRNTYTGRLRNTCNRCVQGKNPSTERNEA